MGRILWLEVSTSNLQIPAKYYIKTENLYGMPVNVEANDGMEHSLIQPIQLFYWTTDGGDPDLASFSIVILLENQGTQAF